MSDEGTGKELVLTSPKAITRSKPSLVEVRGRLVSSDGRFHPTLAASYIEERATGKWIQVGELSRVFTAANTIPGKKRVRRNMFRVFAELLKRGHFLLYEKGVNGRIEAVKLMDFESDVEKQMAIPQLEKMKLRHQLSEDRYQTALCLLRQAAKA